MSACNSSLEEIYAGEPSAAGVCRERNLSEKKKSPPVSVVDDCIDDGVHLLGELGGVGGEFLSRGTSASLLGLEAPVVSARRVFVLTPFAFAFFQPDLLLHFLQVPILNGLQPHRARATGLK